MINIRIISICNYAILKKEIVYFLNLLQIWKNMTIPIKIIPKIITPSGPILIPGASSLYLRNPSAREEPGAPRTLVCFPPLKKYYLFRFTFFSLKNDLLPLFRIYIYKKIFFTVWYFVNLFFNINQISLL